MKQIVTLGLAGLFTLGAATSASAGDSMHGAKFYASGNVSYNSYDVTGAEDDNVWGFGGLLGAEFQTNHHGILVGPEAGWQNFGTVEAAGAPDESKVTGLTAGIKVALPISQDGATRLIARGGSLWWDIENNTGPDNDGQDWYYGGGFDHLLNDQIRIGLDVQFQTLKDNGQEVDFFSTALRGTFLF